MTVVLDYWNRRRQSVRFDDVAGTGRVRWLGRKPKECGGWAMYHEGSWYAVRLEGDGLVFQVGRKKWPMDDDGLHCQNTRHGAARTLVLLRGDEVVLKIKYTIAPELDEPEADRLDLETSDFFYWVAKVWNDTALRDSLRTAWRLAARR